MANLFEEMIEGLS